MSSLAAELLLVCAGCGRPLKPNPRRLRPLCRRCSSIAIANDPAKREKCRQAMLRRFQDPAYAAAHHRRTAVGTAAAMARRPEMREIRREQARAARQKRMEIFHAWCPLEYRVAYRSLIRDKRLRAAQARALIEHQIETDRRRFFRTGQLQATAA